MIEFRLFLLDNDIEKFELLAKMFIESLVRVNSLQPMDYSIVKVTERIQDPLESLEEAYEKDDLDNWRINK